MDFDELVNDFVAESPKFGNLTEQKLTTLRDAMERLSVDDVRKLNE